jgi:hypothetical protein
MWMSSVTLLVLAVSPGKMVLAPLGGVEFSGEARRAASETIAQTLAARHYDAFGPAALEAKLSSEEQAMLKDCVPEVPGCYTKLAPSLGAGSAIVGALTRVEGAIAIDLKVFGADGMLLASARGQARDEAGLPAALEAATLALVVQFEAAPLPLAPPPPPSLGAAFWAPVISGVVVLGAGTYMTIAGQSGLDAAQRDVANMNISETEGGLRINQYTIQRNVGITGMCLGAASIVAGVIFGRPKEEPKPPVELSLGGALLPGGGALSLSGAF